MNTIQKLILKKCPEYDFNQYHFKFGDVVESKDGARVFVIESGLMYVKAFILRSSFKYRRFQYATVPYADLPYYVAGAFKSGALPVLKSLRWRVGAVVHDEWGVDILLTEEQNNGFLGYVVSEDSKYYGMCVFTMNPYRDYIQN